MLDGQRQQIVAIMQINSPSVLPAQLDETGSAISSTRKVRDFCCNIRSRNPTTVGLSSSLAILMPPM